MHGGSANLRKAWAQKAKIASPQDGLQSSSNAQDRTDVFEVLVDGTPGDSKDHPDVRSTFSFLYPVENLDLSIA